MGPLSSAECHNDAVTFVCIRREFDARYCGKFCPPSIDGPGQCGRVPFCGLRRHRSV